jgi:hypothetical protein
MSELSASAMTLSFSCAASSPRRAAFSSRASRSSVTTLVSVWIATCQALRSTHSGTLTSQSTMAAAQTKKNGGRLTWM